MHIRYPWAVQENLARERADNAGYYNKKSCQKSLYLTERATIQEHILLGIGEYNVVVVSIGFFRIGRNRVYDRIGNMDRQSVKCIPESIIYG